MQFAVKCVQLVETEEFYQATFAPVGGPPSEVEQRSHAVLAGPVGIQMPKGEGVVAPVVGREYTLNLTSLITLA